MPPTLKRRSVSSRRTRSYKAAAEGCDYEIKSGNEISKMKFQKRNFPPIQMTNSEKRARKRAQTCAHNTGHVSAHTQGRCPPLSHTNKKRNAFREKKKKTNKTARKNTERASRVAPPRCAHPPHMWACVRHAGEVGRDKSQKVRGTRQEKKIDPHQNRRD